MSHLVIVEGNISAGKSTLTRDLADQLGYKVFLEPTTTNPYLADFYKDPKKYALPMQIYLLKRRFVTYMAALQHMIESGEGAVLDRSIFSDWVFAEKNRLDENILGDGFKYYSELRKSLLKGLPFPHVTVYLDASAETCWERIHGLRMRDAEVGSGGIPLAYLKGLGACYDQLLVEMEESGSDVIRFDWNKFGSVEDVVKSVKQATPIQSEWDLDALRSIAFDPDALSIRTEIDTEFRVDWDDSEFMKMADEQDANQRAELETLNKSKAASSPQRKQIPSIDSPKKPVKQ